MYLGGTPELAGTPRLGVILEYVASWLRPQENHILAVPAEIVATLQSECFSELAAPIERVGARFVPTPAAAALEAVREACDKEGVTYELEHYWRVPQTPFDAEVVSTVERAAKATGAPYRRILSGAGHDAQYMAAICPTGMIFVPSRGGRSHCEEEFTALDDIEHGANALLLACARLAGAE